MLKNAPGGPSKDVMTNVKLDEKLDPSLFSLQPPAGYKTMPFPIVAVDFDVTPAERAAKLLEIYARLMDGRFPAQLDGVVKAVAEKLKPKADEPPSKELLELVSAGSPPSRR